jgi:alpha-tubulin suppressor-like RCC1 family protein
VRRARGAVACWGSNAEGGLGDGTLDDRVVPTPVLDIDDAAEIAAGGLSACVRRRDGTVSCWGAYHTFEPSQGSLRPVTVAGLADVVEIRTSQPGGKYCARTGSNQILCWNVDGNVPAPTAIPELSGARALAVSVLSVCTLTDSRDVLCVNQPGMETSLREGVSDAVEIAGGSTHVCWRRATGTVRCWDSAGVLFGSASPTSGDLASDATAVEITAGQIHVCARLADDGIACFNDPGSPPGVGNPTLVRVPNLPP